MELVKDIFLKRSWSIHMDKNDNEISELLLNMMIDVETKNNAEMGYTRLSN